MARLTPRQSAFVREYLVDLNAAQAAVRAGYSARAAASCGPRLLKSPQVLAAVAQAQKERAQRLEVSADDVLRELVRIARVDVGEAFDDNGRLRPFRDIPEDTRRAISAVDVEELDEGGLLKKVKCWDKVKALELLAKHLGLLRDKVEVSGSGGAPLVIEVRTFGGES